MTERNRALFVVSTGRCGTQWLADALSRRLGDRAVVAHEPLDHDYAPREMLGAGDPHRLDSNLAEPILDHVDFIEEVLESKPYIECGHPSWSSIPYLLRRFEGRVKVVHLVRHPVPTALSWLTHLAYCRPAPHLAEKVLLSPFDEGVRFPSYRQRWDSMTPYEKSLYYWLEVNALACALPEALRIRYEELFEASTLDRFLAFAGLGGADGAIAPERLVDRFRYLTPLWFAPHLIEEHAEVMSLATRLGYDPLGFDEGELIQRYRTI